MLDEKLVVDVVMDWKDLDENIDKYDLNLYADEGREKEVLENFLDNHSGMSYLVKAIDKYNFDYLTICKSKGKLLTPKELDEVFLSFVDGEGKDKVFEADGLALYKDDSVYMASVMENSVRTGSAYGKHLDESKRSFFLKNGDVEPLSLKVALEAAIPYLTKRFEMLGTYRGMEK